MVAESQNVETIEEWEEIEDYGELGVFKNVWHLVQVGEDLTSEGREFEKHLTPAQEKALKELFVFRSELSSQLKKNDRSRYLVDEIFDLNGEVKDSGETFESYEMSDGTEKKMVVVGATKRKIKVRRLWEQYLFSEVSLPEPKTNYADFIRSAVKQIEGWKKEIVFERIKVEDVNKPEQIISTSKTGEFEPKGADTVTVYLSVEWKAKGD